MTDFILVARLNLPNVLIRNKAKKTGVSASKIRAIYNRGLAAYRTSGHRKGVSPQAWAMARVNSALTGGKAAKVDRDILAKEMKNLFLLSTHYCENLKATFRVLLNEA